MSDAKFISGDFFEYQIPKDKRYLKKYFTTEIQEKFISYLLIFGHYENFVDHTGIFCKKRYMQQLYSNFIEIQNAHSKAKKDMNLELLSKIEDGNFSIKQHK